MKKLQRKKVQGGKIATRKNCNMEILQHEQSAT